MGCGTTGCASCEAARWALPVTTFGIRVSLYTGVVELNASWLAALVLVALPVIKLLAYDASEGGIVVFSPALVEGVVEDLIVVPRANCIMASASSYFQAML